MYIIPVRDYFFFFKVFMSGAVSNLEIGGKKLHQENGFEEHS